MPWNATFGTHRTMATQLVAAAAALRLLPKGANWHCEPITDIRWRELVAPKRLVGCAPRQAKVSPVQRASGSRRPANGDLGAAGG